jgi:hypothetical protein
MTSRVVTFAGSSVRIDCDGAESTALVEFLFRGLPSEAAPDPHVTFEVQGAGPDGTLTLRSGGKRLYQGVSAGALGRMLVERAAFHLSDRSVGGLLLHGAAVSKSRRGLLLPGRSGAGKSTLTAWLVSQGYRYLTDELVYIPAGTSEIVPFARPLNIRTSGLAALEAGGVPVDPPGTEILKAPGLALVRPPPSEERGPQATADLGVLVFPGYRRDGPFSVIPMSKAEAGLQLMACLINARNLSEHGHSEVARVVREVPAFRAVYGDFRELAPWLLETLSRL